MKPTPLAIGFPEPVLRVGHLLDFRQYDEKTNRVGCLRCHAMVSATEWAGETCPGELKEPA